MKWDDDGIAICRYNIAVDIIGQLKLISQGTSIVQIFLGISRMARPRIHRLGANRLPSCLQPVVIL